MIAIGVSGHPFTLTGTTLSNGTLDWDSGIIGRSIGLAMARGFRHLVRGCEVLEDLP
jgi:hypothetical protein